MTDKKLDNSASDQDENLETELGNLIKIDSQAFQDWLEANNSFKFVAGFSGCHSYRARKEALRGVNYWYAVKRVNGVLHKKFIGKSHEVTHSRLCEVANVIMQPPKPRVTAASTYESSTPGLEDRVKQLELIVNQLRGSDTAGETETLLDVEYLPSEELETKIQELTNELTNKDSKLSELTIQICEIKIEAKAAKNDATLLNQEVQRLANELDSKNSKLTELTSELANKDRELQELTNNIVNLNSQLQKLQSVPQPQINEQLTTDNGQVTEQKTGNGELQSIPPAATAVPNDELPVTNEQLADIEKSTIENIRTTLKRKNKTVTAEQIRKAFKAAGWDGSNYQEIRKDILAILSGGAKP